MSINWKSSYKLPLSFIIFFVLTFFLLGEQLPVLSPYIFGPHEGDAIHILARAPADALHRPVAYLIIATICWLLLRFFSWPLVWIISGTLWVMDQLFIRPGEPGKYFSFTFSFTLSTEKIINSIVVFLGWGILALLPYFIYRWIDKKWGGKGIWKAMLILFLVNLIIFIFMAYQILVLHHIFGLHQNTEGQKVTTPRLPSKTCPDKLIEAEGKHTKAYWNGKTLEVAGDEQKWVEANCPGVLEKP